MKTLFDLTGEDLRPMSLDETKFFIAIALGPVPEVFPEEYTEECFKKALSTDEALPWVIKIMLLRLARAEDCGRISVLALTWCASMCSTPGDAVMFAHALYRMSLSVDVTLSHLTEGCMAWGVPSDKGKAKIWAGQKVGGDNALDAMSAWRRD